MSYLRPDQVKRLKAIQYDVHIGVAFRESEDDKSKQWKTILSEIYLHPFWEVMRSWGLFD
jgi:hypothetical protein